MCKRVLVLHNGEQIYDGEFSELIRGINPERRLVFEFGTVPEQSYLNNLKNKFKFELNDNILTAQLPESELKNLLSTLLDEFSPQSMSFEELPVEETMKSFFQNPQNYL